jgi:hypothetical protein
MLYEVTDTGLKRREVGKFAALGMYERADLQRLLRQDPTALGEDLLVIAEEFGGGRIPAVASTYSRSTGLVIWSSSS